MRCLLGRVLFFFFFYYTSLYYIYILIFLFTFVIIIIPLFIIIVILLLVVHSGCVISSLVFLFCSDGMARLSLRKVYRHDKRETCL